MNLTTEHANGVAVVRIGESRLMYPLLSEFSTVVTQLIAAGERKVDVAMRTIKMTNGTQVALDGDLLSVLESLYVEVTAKRELERTFEDMVREIQNLIDQMNDAERRQYLAESLFLNTVSYENERLGAYMKKLTKK